jgi:hypothetical protein
MIAYLKKTWWLILAIVILLTIVFRGCNNLPTHKDEKKSLDSTAEAYQLTVTSQQRKIIDLEFREDSLQKRLDTTSAQLMAVRKDMSVRVDAVRRTLSSGSQAAQRRDTMAILINWDSLRAQVIAGLPVIAASDSLSQQVIDDCFKKGAVKDSLVVAYETMWREANTAYAKTKTAYDGLYSDYRKASSRLKFNKTLTRVEAVVILAALAKILIFK